MDDQNEKRNSHWGTALAIGILTGVAAGIFINSKKGQALTKEAKKAALDLQKHVTRKAKKIARLTYEKYADLVDDIVDHYQNAKTLTAEQIGLLKDSLMDKWDDIREQIEDEDNEEIEKK